MNHGIKPRVSLLIAAEMMNDGIADYTLSGWSMLLLRFAWP